MSIGNRIIHKVREEIIGNLRDGVVDSLEDVFQKGDSEHENFDGLIPIGGEEWNDSDFGLFTAPWAAIDKALDMANSVVDEILGEDTSIYMTPYDGSFDYSDWNPLLNPEDNYNRLGQGLVDFEVVENGCEKCLLITFSLFGLLPLNPIIYCRRHESPECQEEPIPEDIEIEEQEEGGVRRTEVYTLPAGIYYLPFATEQAKRERPWVWFLNEDGSLHTQNIKYRDARRTSYFAWRNLDTGSDINSGEIFYSDYRYTEANWLEGEERERWKYVDSYGVPSDRNGRHSWEDNFIEEDYVSYGIKPTFYPKIYCRASQIKEIKQTHPDGTVVQNFWIRLCDKLEILYRTPWRLNRNFRILKLHLGRVQNAYEVLWLNKISQVFSGINGGDTIIGWGEDRRTMNAGRYLEANPDEYSFVRRRWRFWRSTTNSRVTSWEWFLRNRSISYVVSRGENIPVTHAIPYKENGGFGTFPSALSSVSEHFQKVTDLDIICKEEELQEPQPPMSRCCSGAQCREIIKRLRNVERMIKKFENVISPDSFPARLPRKLIDPKNPRKAGLVKLDDYPEMIEYVVRQIDRAVGPPIVVSLDDTNDAKEGDQPYEVTCASINDALRQLLQFTLESGGDIDTLTNMAARTLFEIAITHKISAETRAELAETVEWLGFEGEEKKEDIPFFIDPTLDGKPLDALTEEETEAILGDLLKETKLGITYYENREENTLVTRLMTIQKEANAAAAAVGTPVNSKWDIFNRLRSFDLNRVVGGLQLMRQIRESFLASAGDSESFLQTIDEIILRYTENASPVSEDNRHDFQIEKNTETGKPTVEIEVTEHITDKADEFRHRSNSSDFWRGKGFGDGKNYTERRRNNSPRR